MSSCERANLFKIYLGGLCARKRKRNTQDWELTLTEATHLCEEEQNGTETRTSNKDSLSDLLVSVYLLPSLGDGPSNHVPRLYRRGKGSLDRSGIPAGLSGPITLNRRLQQRSLAPQEGRLGM